MRERERERERERKEGGHTETSPPAEAPGTHCIGHQNLIRVPCIGKVIKDARSCPKVEYN